MTDRRAPPGHSLDAAQRQQLADRLQQRRQALLAAIAEQQQGESRAEHARELLEQDGDDATQRDADREVELARLDSETSELAAIGAALARLDDPAFGQCRDCDAPIPFARLLAEPGALRCVACAAAREGPAVRHTL